MYFCSWKWFFSLLEMVFSPNFLGRNESLIGNFQHMKNMIQIKNHWCTYISAKYPPKIIQSIRIQNITTDLIQ